MAIHAQVEGVGTLEFPDDTPTDVIDQTVQRVIAEGSKATPAAPAPTPAAEPKKELSFWDKIGQAYYNSVPVGGYQMGPMEKSLGHTVGTTIPSWVQGANLALRGKEPTAAQVAETLASEEEYRKSRDPKILQHESDVESARKIKSEAESRAKVWEPPKADDYMLPGDVPMLDVASYKRAVEESAPKREAAIKTRMQQAGVEDTPANRKAIEEQDRKDLRKAEAGVYKKKAEIFKNPEAMKEFAGEIVGGMGPIYAAAALAGTTTKSPAAADAVLFLADAPQEVRQRFVQIMSDKLEGRGLPPTAENFKKLYEEDNGDFLKIAKYQARIGGVTSSAVMTAGMRGAGNLANAASSKAAKTVEREIAKSNASRELATKLASEGKSSEAAAELRKVLTPVQQRELIHKAQAEISTAERVGNQIKSAALNLGAPALGQVAGDFAATGDVNPEAVLEKLAGQSIFVIPEALHLSAAYRRGRTISRSSPANVIERDISDIREELSNPRDTTNSEALADALLAIHPEFYHNTGEAPADRAHLRDNYAASMKDAADTYRTLIEAEQAKPPEAQDAERLKDLESKLKFASEQVVYTSPHPGFPDVTVEEAVHYLRREKEAENVEDPAEAEKLRNQAAEDFNSLIEERRREREKNADVGSEVGQAGEAVGRGAGEGDVKLAPEGEAGAPRPEGTGTERLDSTLADVAGSNVGEAGARGPLDIYEVGKALRQIRDSQKLNTDTLYKIADRLNIKYDPQEEVADIYHRVRDRLEQLKDAHIAESEMPADDLRPRRTAEPSFTSIEPTKADDVVRKFKEDWDADINVAHGVDQIREASGINVPDNSKGFYDPRTGKIWINSALHSTEADIKATIFHETLGHHGLFKKYGEELDGLLHNIYEKNEGIRKDVESWRNEKLSDTETNADTYSHLDENTRIAREVEEVLARKSEAGQVQTGVFRQLIALVRKYLRMIPKIGEQIKYSDNDILHILRDAHEAATKGKDTFTLDPEGEVRHSFKGPQAKLTEKEEQNKVKAISMEKAGVSPKSIQLMTGWARNPLDNGWRLEYSDAKTSLMLRPDELQVGHPIRLKDLFDHPELYDSYPELAAVEVRRTYTGDALARAYERTKSKPAEIEYSENITNPEVLRKSLLHEIGHVVQDIEGWGPGGSTKTLPSTLREADRKSLGAEIVNLMDLSHTFEWVDRAAERKFTEDGNLRQGLLNGDPSSLQYIVNNQEDLTERIVDLLHDTYERLGGETESRLIERRMDMSPQDLKRKPIDWKYEFRRSILPESSATGPLPLPRNSEESVRYSKATFGDLKNKATERPKFDRTMYDRFLNAVSNINPYQGIRILDIEKVAQLYEKDIPPVRTVADLTGRLAAIHQTKELENNNLSNKWYKTLQDLEKKNPDISSELSDVAHKSTIWQIDPLTDQSKQIHADVKSGAIKNPTQFDRMTYNLMERWNKLDPAAQKVYVESRQYYTDALERFLNTVEQYAGKDAASKLRQAYLDSNLRVYLPLFRNGDYWIKATDANGHKYVASVTSVREQKKLAAWLKSQNYKDVVEYVRSANDWKKGVSDNQLLSKVIESMQAKGAGNELMQAVYETFLDHANVSGMANMFREREGIEGYVQSMLTAFTPVAGRMERAIANLEYGDKFRIAMEDFTAKVQNNLGPGYTATDLPVEYSTLQSHLQDHINTVLSPPRASAIGKGIRGLTSVNYYWTIAMSASTGLFNTMSNPAVSLPMLVGAHGGRAYEAYANAQKMYLDGGWETAVHDLVPDWTFMAKAKGEYKLLGDALIARGVVTRANGADLHSFRDISPEDWSRRIEGSKRVGGFIMQNTERMNREVAALAAYTLKRRDGASIKESIEYAVRHVEAVHGPGSTLTTPPVFKTPAGALVYNLKRYPFTVTFQMAKLLNEATRGMDANTRKVAAKQLAATAIHSGILFGGMGMPFMGAVSVILAVLHAMGLLGDKDKPFDPEDEIHNLTGFDLDGAIPTALGIDPSSMKLNDVLWRENSYDWEKSDPLDYLAHQIGGVTWSVNANFIRGAKQMWDGDYMKGAETISPAALKRLMKTYRYASQGAKTTGGVPMVTADQKEIKLGPYDYTIQALGFTPKDIADFQRRHNSVMQKDKFVDKKTAEYKKKLFDALDKGDGKDVSEYAQRWINTQLINGRVLTPQSIENLLSGYIAKKKNSAFMVDGVRGSMNKYLSLRRMSAESDWTDSQEKYK